MTADVCRVKYSDAALLAWNTTARVEKQTHETRLRGLALRSRSICQGEEGRPDRPRHLSRAKTRPGSPVGVLATDLLYVLPIYTCVVYMCVRILRLDQ